MGTEGKAPRSPAETEKQVRHLLEEGDYGGTATVAIRALGPEVLRYLRATLRDEADAADAYSHWEEALWRGLRSFRWKCSLRTWALRLATNAAANARSTAWRRRVRRFQTGEASALADEVRISSLVRVERKTRGLERLRQELSPQDQALVHLRIDQRLSFEELAEALADTPWAASATTLCKRYERLKERLKRLVREQELDE